MRRSTFLRGAMGAAALASLPTMAAPAAWPAKPVRLVVGYPPGGTTDIMARLLATGLSEKLGQSFIVDNRAGASGMIGSGVVANAPADGYTLLFSASNLAVYTALYDQVPFDPEKDLLPISMVATSPYVMVVHPSLPVKNLAELVDYVHAHPGKLNYGASTPGGGQQLGWEMFKRQTKSDMVYVPYRGTGAMMPDLLSGTLQAAIDNVAVLAPQIRNGSLRAICVTSQQRSPLLPDVPTAVEAGLHDLVVVGWFGVLAPSRTPEPIQQRLAKAIAEVVDGKDVIGRMQELGAQPDKTAGAAFGTFIHGESVHWGGLIKEVGIKMQ